ncbi:protein prune homolog 2 [Trichonephila clavipes]|nr:protein prune homolog 2 [Trichonephila clavipes]
MVSEGTGTLKRIAVNPKVLESQFIEDDQRSLSSLSNRSDAFSQSEDIILDDDAATIEDLDDNSDCDSDLDSPLSDPIPEMSAAEEFEEERSWKSCTVNGEDRKIDMKVIEPYRKVLSHGGYQGDGNAIIIFSACYLPDRSRKDYEYVMDNLFLYVIVTLDELVAEDYILIYLHGATERSNMPSFGWLKRCYQMIDRRLRKNLKGLYLVHPTFWLKTIVIMTRPFISSKFTRKLKFVYSLKELSNLVTLDYVCIPDKVKQFDEDLFPD